MLKHEYETITSRRNALLVETHKLSDRKHRNRTGLFRFDGVKLTAEALSRGVALTAVLLRESDAACVLERVFSMCDKEFSSETRVCFVADPIFDSLSEESAPEGIICVASMQGDVHRVWTDAPDSTERVMLLESVRDPSNLGAIIRSAAAFGVDRLVLSADCADIYNAKTVRASMGTLFSQQIDRVDDLTVAIAALRADGRRVYAAALDERAARLDELDARAGDCAVIGNEGHGLSAETLAACTSSVYIPMTDRAESLNAAVAAAVLMWEFCRADRGDSKGDRK
ncbi:MAG: RNA methyltransferase [Clostridia bacterium]|nr:RNA methyltransferase [Clostridia bacterium]